MNYFLLIAVLVLASETKADGNGTSAAPIAAGNGTSGAPIAAVTTPAPATTGAPSSFGASIFSRLIREFDVLKAKDKALSAKTTKMSAKLRGLDSTNAALLTKFDTLIGKVETLTSEVQKTKLSSQTIERLAYGKGSPVRLVGSSKSGRLEVFHNGKWGTVCDDDPNSENKQGNNNMAIVVCRELGYSGGTIHNSASKGQGSGAIWLDDVQCTGSENSIFDCPHTRWGVENCQHYEDVGVTCS